MKIKICGLRRVEDAERALARGATHLGVVLAPDSPRRASVAEARAIVRTARGRAEPVLVFRSVGDDAIVVAAETLGVRRVQVHGAGPDRVAALERRGLLPIPVVRVTAGATELPVFASAATSVRPALLDGGRGGAGRAFAWQLLGDRAPVGVFVAGGIGPDNVARLLARRPWGIDVCSGVERAPGIKHSGLLDALFDAIRDALPHPEVLR